MDRIGCDLKQEPVRLGQRSVAIADTPLLPSHFFNIDISAALLRERAA